MSNEKVTFFLNLLCKWVEQEYSVRAEQEYRFAPPRRWRFDAAFPERMVAVEIEGGAFTGGRHFRGVGAIKDMEKYNAAAAMDWRVFRFTPQQLENGAVRDFLSGKGVLRG
jgi:hypothetical protein